LNQFATSDNRERGKHVTINQGLDELRKSDAYHAGRLLAVCQQIQLLANPDVGVTYVDSFFSSASTNPDLILPRVWNIARRRLRQIADYGTRNELEDMANRAVSSFENAWPSRLMLKRQGEFQLGYFHQRACIPTPGLRRYLTIQGISVQSYGEKLIADILDRNGIPFAYDFDARITVPDVSKESGKNKLDPDFAIHSTAGERHLYIEYCGKRGDEVYDKQWVYKAARYRKLKARTLKDVETDGVVTEHTYCEIIPEDLRNTKNLEKLIVQAVRRVVGEDVVFKLAAEATPF